MNIDGSFEWSEQKDEGNYVENISARGLYDFNFSFSTDTGKGDGTGSLYDNYTGYCVGSSWVGYNFTIYAGLDKESGNLTVGWGVPNPAGGSTTINCGGQISDAAFGFGHPVAPYLLSFKIPTPSQANEGILIEGKEGDVVYTIVVY